ncbi:protein S100-A9-like [Dromiciops gliroides]|uniref:protein S100-A9-like n=1 Tax=Dromiciops gliroides TaxID=33562 RepID=UPI001CC3BF5F|nr:protein S100-A9-like [Dromiciops gliroides]XP_043819225.1 protein S100-A9-like [Dromiciops gliroides]XP_043819226.1 protein S100-A9-like [Dromiciops gliroides]
MAPTKYTASEEDLNTIIDIFHNYSHESGEEDALEKKELEEFIKKEAPNYLKYLKEQNTSLDSVFKKADVNNDKHLFFPEFVAVLGEIAIEIHNRYHREEGPEGPDGPEGHGHGHGHSHGHRH